MTNTAVGSSHFAQISYSRCFIWCRVKKCVTLVFQMPQPRGGGLFRYNRDVFVGLRISNWQGICLCHVIINLEVLFFLLQQTTCNGLSMMSKYKKSAWPITDMVASLHKSEHLTNRMSSYGAFWRNSILVVVMFGTLEFIASYPSNGDVEIHYILSSVNAWNRFIYCMWYLLSIKWYAIPFGIFLHYWNIPCVSCKFQMGCSYTAKNNNCTRPFIG